ncbi:hypothetical protein ACN28S_33950 [Cystobacter fuscus]
MSWLASLGLGLAAAGCGPTEDEKPTPPAPTDYTHPLPENTPICGRSDFNEMFPYSIRSTTLPVLVHYYKESERETAQQVLAFVEKGWDYHVNQLGMRPAITDAGECGPDEAFDVFVWKGHRSCLVNVLSGEPTTAWDDRRGYMIVDPWGPYGGAELEETVVHEMAHASQAADDWYESPITFEMSAVFTDQVYANRYIKTYFDDFQAHPDWALDYYDEYETWYMYGSSMYLLYLKDRFFGGDARFLSSMWLKSRNPPGAGEDQTLNDPDFADALDELLASHGSSYVQSVPEFSRWRWYTGDHVDDNHFRHFKDGLENLRAAKIALAAQQEPAREDRHRRERADDARHELPRVVGRRGHSGHALCVARGPQRRVAPLHRPGRARTDAGLRWRGVGFRHGPEGAEVRGGPEAHPHRDRRAHGRLRP